MTFFPGSQGWKNWVEYSISMDSRANFVFLRVLLAKRPDICLPTFLAWYPIWLDYQNYISSQCTWPQKLGSGGQNRALGPDLCLRSKLSVFGVWDILRPGAHMVGLTKKSYFRYQLAIKLGWPEAKEIFKFQKICQPNGPKPKIRQNHAWGQNHACSPLFWPFLAKIWKKYIKSSI